MSRPRVSSDSSLVSFQQEVLETADFRKARGDIVSSAMLAKLSKDLRHLHVSDSRQDLHDCKYTKELDKCATHFKCEKLNWKPWPCMVLRSYHHTPFQDVMSIDSASEVLSAGVFQESGMIVKEISVECPVYGHGLTEFCEQLKGKVPRIHLSAIWSPPIKELPQIIVGLQFNTMEVWEFTMKKNPGIMERLEALSIVDFEFNKNNFGWLMYNLQRCSKLHLLDFSGCNLSSFSPNFSHPTVQTLLLRNASIGRLTNLPESLHTLDFRCRRVDEIGIIDVHCKSLDTLYLNVNQSTLHNYNRLGQLKSLRSLTCEGDFTDIPLTPLSACEALVTLNLSNCKVADIAALSACEALKHLNLKNCYALKNINALASCRSLVTLNLSNCWKVEYIDALATCTSLVTLNLQGCTSLTNIDALARCTSLETLDLHDCESLTNIDALASCTSLEKIYLYGCNALTIETVANLHALGSLQMIDANDSWKLLRNMMNKVELM